MHGRPDAERFHVRGFNEQGTTTTPFDMVVLNGMSRFHLAAEAMRRAPPEPRRAPTSSRRTARRCSPSTTPYVREHLEDQPEIRDWVWTD